MLGWVCVCVCVRAYTVIVVNGFLMSIAIIGPFSQFISSLVCSSVPFAILHIHSPICKYPVFGLDASVLLVLRIT